MARSTDEGGDYSFSRIIHSPFQWNGHNIYVHRSSGYINEDDGRLKIHTILYCLNCNRESTVRFTIDRSIAPYEWFGPLTQLLSLVPFSKQCDGSGGTHSLP